MSSSISRSSPNWIHQWAAQVAEETNPVEAISPRCSSKSSPRTLPDCHDLRPRRTLPSVPAHLASRSSAIDTSDSETIKPKWASTNHHLLHSFDESQQDESGGESDLDTADERLSEALRAKLRLAGLHHKSSTTPKAPLSSPRRTPAGAAAEVVYPPDEDVEHSDSSSEVSDPYKDTSIRPPVDKNPPLKFNRAFR